MKAWALIGLVALSVLTGVVLLGGLGSGFNEPGTPTPPSAAPQTHAVPAHPSAAPRPDPEATTLLELVKAGWDRKAAQAVVTQNREFLVLLAEEPAHGGYQRVLTLLKGLGEKKYRHLQPFLQAHPETVGLLAQSADPDLLARSFDIEGQDYLRVAGLYLLHSTASDALEVAHLLQHNRSVILKLLERGVLGAEALFLFERGSPGAEEYDAWLREELLDRLAGQEEGLASLINFVLAQGEELRRRLESDVEFRKCFRNELWLRLARVVAQPGQGLELYAGEPKLWDLLARPEGESLLKDWGLLPILLLQGQTKYPADLKPQVIRALIQGDEAAVEALLLYQHDEEFYALLRRKLPDATLVAALARLRAAGPDYPQKLRYFQSLSDAALCEELSAAPTGLKTWLPLWDTYYLGRKLWQGRDTDVGDWFRAAADPASFLVPVLKGGKAVKTAKVLTISLRHTGKGVAEKQLGKIAARMSAKQLSSWTATGLLAHAQDTVRQLDRASTLEVTRAVRFLYQHGPLQRASFRKLTGLEARLFQRGDARVFLHLGRLGHPKLQEYLNEQALELLQEAITTPGDSSTKADQPLRVSQNTILHHHILSRPQQLSLGQEAWRRHVAAWWLLGVAGLDQPPGKTP